MSYELAFYFTGVILNILLLTFKTVEEGKNLELEKSTMIKCVLVTPLSWVGTLIMLINLITYLQNEE